MDSIDPNAYPSLLHQDNINTQQYWDNRFEANWTELGGEEQTLFFAQVAVSLMPHWLKSEIKSRRLSICDFGCANGQAAQYLLEEFGVPVSATDFSETAISAAKTRYSDVNFYVSDITAKQPSSYNVGFCSNVLEHLDDPWKAAQSISNHIIDYLIIMIPFRERLATPEHVQRFDNDVIPITIGELQLSYVGAIDASFLPDSKYHDSQVLLVYSADKRITMLSDYVNGIESLGIQSAISQLKDELNYTRAQLQSMKELYIATNDGYQAECRLNGTIQERYTTLEGRYHELVGQNDRLAASLSDSENNTVKLKEQLTELCYTLDTETRAVKKYRSRIESMEASYSWKIGRLFTLIPRWVKRKVNG